MSNKFLPAYVMGYSDSSFTNPHEVALPDEPPDCEGSFTHMGAKYWGFETTRHRATTLNEDKSGFRFDHNAHHWLKLGLGTTSVVKEVKISTRWFTGNHVPFVSVTLYQGGIPVEVIERAPLNPDDDHIFSIKPTHADECLIKCFHEGGIARINLMGEPLSAQPRVNLLEGASISHVSNDHYGKPEDAVIGNRKVDYMLGWESARTGFGEQALFHLQKPANVEEIIVDTYMHRLNAPLACHIFGLPSSQGLHFEAMMERQPRWTIRFDSGESVRPTNFQRYMLEQKYLEEPVPNPKQFSIKLVNEYHETWMPLIKFGRLFPDQYHRFNALRHKQPISHLLYMHYPNGGVHGLKAYGNIEASA